MLGQYESGAVKMRLQVEKDHLPSQDQLLSFTQCSRNANLLATSLKAWPPSLFFLTVLAGDL